MSRRRATARSDKPAAPALGELLVGGGQDLAGELGPDPGPGVGAERTCRRHLLESRTLILDKNTVLDKDHPSRESVRPGPQLEVTPCRLPLPPPGWFTRNVFNRAVARPDPAGRQRPGLPGPRGPGRKSGQPRRTPVNLLDFEGAVPGRPAGQRRVGAQRPGRRRPAGPHPRPPPGRPGRREVTGADKVPVLRAYLRRWKAEVGVFFDGVGPDSTDEEIAAIAPRHPVFELSGPAGQGPA